MNNNTTPLAKLSAKEALKIAQEKAYKLKLNPSEVNISTKEELTLSKKGRVERNKERGAKHLLIECPKHGLTLTVSKRTTCIECEREYSNRSKYGTKHERNEWEGKWIRIYRYVNSNGITLYVGMTSKKIGQRHSQHASGAWKEHRQNKWHEYLRQTYKNAKHFMENLKPEIIHEELVDKDADPMTYRCFESTYIEDCKPIYNTHRKSYLHKKELFNLS